MRPRILIDLDGVIHKYSKGFHDGTLYDEVMPGARDFINNMKDIYEIVIFTARISKTKKRFAPPSAKKDVEDWLMKNGIHFDLVTSDKLPAIAYIDDRAIEFRGKWKYVYERLRELDSEAKEEFDVKCWKKDINKIENRFKK
jgi:hypothetical protein